MDKWSTVEQWEDAIKIIFDFDRKEEEIETKFLNLVLGRDKRLKRFIDAHSNLSTSDIFCQRKRFNNRRIILYYCDVPGEIPSCFFLPNANNINANISKTIGNQLIMQNQGTLYSNSGNQAVI